MEYEMIEIYNRPAKIGTDTYNFIIQEKWTPGWGVRFAKGRRKPKFYEIKKNGETILTTTLHQTFYKRQREIEKEAQK